MKAQLIKVNGEITAVTPKGKRFSLDELRWIIDADLVEIVNSVDGRVIVCDEEGKLFGQKPINETASALYSLTGVDFIVGDVVVCEPDQIE